MFRFALSAPRLSVLALAFMPLPVAARTAPPVAAVQTAPVARTITIGGVAIPYDASFAEYVLKDATGAPRATISGTSYVRRDVQDAAARPVLFAFNGGPGASSSPLHFDAMGPRVLTSARTGVEDNPQSLLDAADLVFVDPVGTGFSRTLGDAGKSPYWTVPDDADAMLRYIRQWLKAHGRAASPVYIAGESYGGTRLAMLAKDAGDLNLAGLIFVSPSLDPGEDKSDLAFALALPSMAVAAVQNGRVDAAGRSVPQIFEEARAFALSDYLVALAQGSALPPADKARMAQRMSAIIGLPAGTIARTDLRVDTEDYRKALRQSEGLVVGRLDTRVTAPVPKEEPNRPSAANDPALGLGKSNVILSKPIAAYLRDELHVPVDRDYVSLSLDVNFQWDWTKGASFIERPDLLANVRALMEQKPALRVMMITGYYDLTIPVMAVRYRVEHAQLPMDRVELAERESGHSVLGGAEGRATMRPLLIPFLTK